MAIVPCRECKRDVSDQAAACPHCGVASPATAPAAVKKDTTGETIGCVVLTLVAVGMFAMCTSMYEDETAAPGAGSVLGAATTRAGYVGCMTREQIDRAVTLTNDPPAFAQMLANPAGSGCTRLQPGLRVQVEDNTVGGLIRIRLQGELAEVWTVREAVAR